MVTRPQPRGREGYRHFTTITMRWADNDAYGHVNNTVYYGWFDSAVNQWLIGQGLLDIVAGNPIGLVVETACRYFAPLTFPGEVEVGLGLDLASALRASPTGSACSRAVPRRPPPRANSPTSTSSAPRVVR